MVLEGYWELDLQLQNLARRRPATNEYKQCFRGFQRARAQATLAWCNISAGAGFVSPHLSLLQVQDLSCLAEANHMSRLTRRDWMPKCCC